ncbi:hypothetical protein [Sporosarcina sp. FA9]|uniref:hypothetical protein n=1 Tax=Sporosarcina sp. FA9 TaxID=3413030 RepID=UPI003F65BA8C
MQKRFVKYLLTVIFFIIYFKACEFIWSYLPVSTSVAVLEGSIIVVVVSLVLAAISTNKVIGIIQS